MSPRVSVIVPCSVVDDRTKECLKQCNGVDYDNFEVILLPDEMELVEGATVVPTGPGLPGRKRNLGGKVATGEVLAFIDADAYPHRAWLKNAIKYLQGEKVGAVGGPGLTPPTDGKFARAQGDILGSYMMGGLSGRYSNQKARDSDDIHSVNFVAWRHVVEEAGGWDERFWPGEDTLMCLSIKKMGYRQLMAPDVVVFHHRRPTWKGYLTQISRYAVHRGYFAKRFPGNSRRLGYFLPSLMLFGFVFLLLASPFSAIVTLLVFVLMVAYLGLVVGAIGKNSFREAGTLLIGIPLTHLVYGLGFMKGLASRRLSR